MDRVEVESKGMIAVIQLNRMLDKYELEALSESYKEQLERGVVILEQHATIELIPTKRTEAE